MQSVALALASFCLLLTATTARITVGGEQTEVVVRELAIKAADEVRERIRDFKVELDEVAENFRHTNTTCNGVIEERLAPCLECMTGNCRAALSSLCSSTDNVRNVLTRLRGLMRDDWKSEQIVVSLNRDEILYHNDVITAVSNAIANSPLNHAITALADRGLAIVRGFEGLTQYYVPVQTSNSRPSVYSRVKESIGKAWKKFKDVFKPRGCADLERSATRLCVHESINLKLKCSQCSQLFDPRTGCPEFEEALLKLGLLFEKARSLNNHLVGHRNTISFRLESVRIFDADDDKLQITANVNLLDQILEVSLNLDGNHRYKRHEATLMKKIADAIAERILDVIIDN